MLAAVLAPADNLVILPEWQGPVVVVDYRPPCRLTRSEISNGPDGVMPGDVVKSLCRALEVGPGALEFDIDPANRRGIHEAASCYVIDPAGVRVARVRGESAVWLTVAAGKLAADGWRPGRVAS